MYEMETYELDYILNKLGDTIIYKKESKSSVSIISKELFYTVHTYWKKEKLWESVLIDDEMLEVLKNNLL